MIVPLTVLSSLLFSVIYPLCFWISFKDPLKNNFHKFHIGLPNVVGGVTVVFLLFMDIPLATKVAVVFWKAIFIAVSRFSWKKEYPDARLMTVPSLAGLYAFWHVQSGLLGTVGFASFAMWLLGGLIFCSALFAMNLGHWYLNVHGLPPAHLGRAVYAFGAFLAARLLWDAWFLLTTKILYAGDRISLLQFMTRLDGFLLLVPLFFGLLFPLGSLFFVRGTLLLKNTQATTGILYVILCSVLLGDIGYKYYAIKFGIYL
ncbi:MAG: hypothetical protein HZA28_06650 [Candidatus Omnitrophica bacterium]|nr:hypothetical protein [Candidatus Omnitrophota bacterium]